jgi:rhodanese-related sulfurtransferase
LLPVFSVLITTSMQHFKKFFLLFVIVLPQTLFAQSIAFKWMIEATYDASFPLVYPHQKDILSSAVFLDTRERNEYEVSHINHAKWVGYSDFHPDRLDGISREEVVVVYCSIGVRSEAIGKKLKESGYRYVYNLYGGIFHWVNEGHELVSEAGPTEKIHAYSKFWGIWLNKGKKVYE